MVIKYKPKSASEDIELEDKDFMIYEMLLLILKELRRDG